MKESKNLAVFSIAQFVVLTYTLILVQLAHAQETPAKLFEAQFRAQVQGDYIYLTKNIQPRLLSKIKTAMVNCLSRIQSEEEIKKLEQAMGVKDLRALGELEPHLFMAKVLEPQFSAPEIKSVLSVAKLVIDSEELSEESAIVKYRILFPVEDGERSIDKTASFLKEDGKWYVSANATMAQKIIGMFEACK